MTTSALPLPCSPETLMSPRPLRRKKFCWIGSGNGHDLVTRILEERGWECVPSSEKCNGRVTFQWAQNKSELDYDRYLTQSAKNSGVVLLNHIRNNSILTTKDRLYESFVLLAKKRRSIRILHTLPETYRMGFKPDRDRLRSILDDFESRGESKLWIVKPSNQNQGRGIRVTANFSELRNQFSLNTPSCPRPRPQSRESPLQTFSPRVVPLEPSKLKAKCVEKKNQMSKQNTHCSRSSIAGPPSFLTRPPSKSVRRRMFIAGLEAEIQQTRKCSTFRLDPSASRSFEMRISELADDIENKALVFRHSAKNDSNQRNIEEDDFFLDVDENSDADDVLGDEFSSTALSTSPSQSHSIRSRFRAAASGHRTPPLSARILQSSQSQRESLSFQHPTRRVRPASTSSSSPRSDHPRHPVVPRSRFHGDPEKCLGYSFESFGDAWPSMQGRTPTRFIRTIKNDSRVSAPKTQKICVEEVVVSAENPGTPLYPYSSSMELSNDVSSSLYQPQEVLRPPNSTVHRFHGEEYLIRQIPDAPSVSGDSGSSSRRNSEGPVDQLIVPDIPIRRNTSPSAFCSLEQHTALQYLIDRIRIHSTSSRSADDPVSPVSPTTRSPTLQRVSEYVRRSLSTSYPSSNCENRNLRNALPSETVPELKEYLERIESSRDSSLSESQRTLAICSEYHWNLHRNSTEVRDSGRFSSGRGLMSYRNTRDNSHTLVQSVGNSSIIPTPPPRSPSFPNRKAFAFRHISASQENFECPSPPSPSLQKFASNIHNSAKQRDAETSTRKGAAVENPRILSMSASKGSSHFDRNVTEDQHARKGSTSAARSNRSEVTTKDDLELKKSRDIKVRSDLVEEGNNQMSGSNLSKRDLNTIVQEYIARPLLVNDRKFDIRAFLLIASTFPKYHVYFSPGYCRLSASPYSADISSLSDVTAHLTNMAIQKKHEDYDDMKDDLVISLEQLEESLLSCGNAPAGWVQDQLHPRLQEIARLVFEAGKDRFVRERGQFDLLGLDLFVDEDLRVYLLEVNTNPSLQFRGRSVLEHLVPNLVGEAIDIVISIHESGTVLRDDDLEFFSWLDSLA